MREAGNARERCGVGWLGKRKESRGRDILLCGDNFTRVFLHTEKADLKLVFGLAEDLWLVCVGGLQVCFISFCTTDTFFLSFLPGPAGAVYVSDCLGKWATQLKKALAGAY